MNKSYVVVVVLFSALLWAQSPQSAPDQTPAVVQAADVVMQRLHETLDFNLIAGVVVPDEAARHRDYPGEFLLFPTPRMSKALLNQTADATLRRKLNTDRNLYYLTSVLLKAAPEQLTENERLVKLLPQDFAKAAKKSKYLRNFAGVSQSTTLASASELSEYLAEADALIGILRRSVKPEMLTAPAFLEAAAQMSGRYANVEVMPELMGYSRVYTVGRESLLLVFAETSGGLKLVTVAPVSQ